MSTEHRLKGIAYQHMSFLLNYQALYFVKLGLNVQQVVGGHFIIAV